MDTRISKSEIIVSEGKRMYPCLRAARAVIVCGVLIVCVGVMDRW